MGAILKFLLYLIIAGVKAYIILFLILLLAQAVAHTFLNKDKKEEIEWTPWRAKLFYFAWALLTLYHFIF